MKAILAATLIIFLSACTTYDVKRDSEGIVQVTVKSTRSFDAPDLHYRRDDSGVEFDFSAASADANIDSFVGMFQGMMGMMMQMMERMATPGAQ